MLEQVVIEGGLTVRLEGRPAQGTRHEVLFGSLIDSLAPVAVKLERLSGALERERRVLAWLGARTDLAPRLIAAGTTVIDGERSECLIIERRPGLPPVTTDGWRRMGSAVAQLADLGYPHDGLPIIDHALFVQQHAQRLRELGDRLAPFTDPIPDWEPLAARALPPSTPMVLTHGDPGAGNYLDDSARGTLIDWEEAQVAPLGLDLARLVFIAFLGAGPNGYRGRDHRARASAAATGYLSALRTQWHPSRDDERWWMSVAAIQFIHRRWQLGGRPAPWQAAARVLTTCLTTEKMYGRPSV